MPGNVTVVTLPDDFKRGRVESWNVSFEKELKWGFVGEAAYVGTRQVNQLGVREQNWAPIGGGSAGRQTGPEVRADRAPRSLIAPLGDSHYNGLQTRLSRRFSNGVLLNVNYTLSRAIGIAGAPNSDNQPRVGSPDLYSPEHGDSRHRSHARPEHQRASLSCRSASAAAG